MLIRINDLLSELEVKVKSQMFLLSKLCTRRHLMLHDGFVMVSLTPEPKAASASGERLPMLIYQLVTSRL